MHKIVLHIASDYPGPYSPDHVTVAVHDSIKNLESSFDNYLIVPRRKKKPGQTRITALKKEVHISFFDPVPSYFGGKNRLNWKEIAEELLGDVKPSLVHSHKLSYEAAIGDVLATYWKVPHLITIRGSSDTHWLNHLPLTGARYRSLLERSTNNLWLSMWAQEKISIWTGYVVNKKDLSFPTGVPEREFKNLRRISLPAEKKFVCVARLDDYKQKGILDLIWGFKLYSATDRELSLDIIGPSKPETRNYLSQEIEKAGLSERIKLKGSMARSDIINNIKEYSAFILLSTNETFGLVFVEALLAGVPIVYMKNSGVDGYSFAEKYGVRCESRHPKDVLDAIEKMSFKAQTLRNDLQMALESGLLVFLQAEGMKNRYCAIADSAIKLKA